MTSCLGISAFLGAITIFFALGRYVLTHHAKRWSAAARHALLVSLTLTALLSIPLSLIFTWAKIEVLSPQVFEPFFIFAIPYLAQAEHAIVSAISLPQSLRTFEIGFATLWSLGFLYYAMRFAFGLRGRQGLIRRSTALSPALRHRIEASEVLESKYGRPNSIEMRMSADLRAPALVRSFPPLILLPADAIHWPIEELQWILTHEREHARRFDLLTKWLGLLMRAIYWFHPLAHWTLRRQCVEQERACDDAVLHQGACPCTYAQILFSHALAAEWPQKTSLCLALLSENSSLEERITNMLEQHTNRRALRPSHLMLCGLAASVALTGMVMLQPISAAHAFSYGNETIAADDIRTEVWAHEREVRQCYMYELQRDPASAGRVVIAAVVGPDGGVKEASVESSTVAAALATCIRDVFLPMHFPEPSDHADVHFSYPFLLEPG